jgi:hypothetical protein
MPIKKNTTTDSGGVNKTGIDGKLTMIVADLRPLAELAETPIVLCVRLSQL